TATPDTVISLGLLNILLSQIEVKDAILLIGILLATVGWIATVTTARHLSRRQHTINVLLQHRFNDVLHKHHSIIYTYFPVGTAISKSDTEALFSSVKRQTHDQTSAKNFLVQRKRKVNLPSLKEVHESLTIMLNYYEFLAVGISRCDLNERVMRAFYKSIVCAFCEKTHEFIKYGQNNQPTALENLVELYKIWKRTDQFPLITRSNQLH
ncbi:MAG: DUF4760 domain-containing protein, partial [Pyrinomonadaceae bacterium]